MTADDASTRSPGFVVDDERRLQVRDQQVMRALAHPARLAIMDQLLAGKTATATEFAGVCGLSPSATSYHLRAMARAGLVEEAPSRGDGRERVWQTPHRGLTMDLSADASPELRTAERNLITMLLARDEVQLRRFVDTFGEQDADWLDASAILDLRLMVSAAELKALNQAVIDLLRPYSFSQRHDAPPDARITAVQLRSFPTEQSSDTLRGEDVKY